MQRVATDILGPLPESVARNSYVLVVADYFTWWMEAFPIPNQEATTGARKLIEEVFCRFLPPEQLHSDQGRQFESILIAEVCRLMGVQKTKTMAYHPQSDGLVERWNKTLLHNLSTCVKDHPESWEDYVRPICMAYNTSTHQTTGFTPFYLMFRRQAKLPIELMYGTPEPESVTSTEYATQLQSSREAYQKVRLRTTCQLEHQAELYNQKVHGSPYEVGSHVWVLFPQVPRGRSKKVHRPWSGPFVVIKHLSDVTYRVQIVNSRRRRVVVHFNHLKPYKLSVPTPAKRKNRRDTKRANTPPAHHFGTELELVDDESEESCPNHRGSDNHTPDPGNQEQPENEQDVWHYPQRMRHPPDYYSKCGTHS